VSAVAVQVLEAPAFVPHAYADLVCYDPECVAPACVDPEFAAPVVVVVAAVALLGVAVQIFLVVPSVVQLHILWCVAFPQCHICIGLNPHCPFV
jgi:hypothetical protein